MSLWVLDTDHVSLLLERHPFVSRRVAEVGAEVLGVTEKQKQNAISALDF